MKRYIFAALVALLSFTSCVIESGYTPEKSSVGRLLYNQANKILYQHAIAYSTYIIYADAILNDDTAAIDILKRDLFANFYTEILEDGVRIAHTNGSVTVNTGGKALTEGGVWRLFLYDHTNATYTCTGVVGQQRTFTVSNTNEIESVNITVSYRVSEDNKILLSFSGEGMRNMNNYTLSFNINDEDPIVVRHKSPYMPIRGTMYIDYIETQSGSKHSATAIAKNNSMEFINR